jgi:hypothetical protein
MENNLLFKQIALCCLLNLCFIISKSQWIDDFSDGNFTSNPEWLGDTSKFKVNSNGMLQLNALTTDVNAQLLTKSKVNSKASWSFNIQMDFNPSSGNYAKVYLMSDTSNLSNSVNGYFVRIGYTADDICLYKQTGTVSTLLIDGRDKMLNSNTVNTNILITRDSIGNWQLLCDTTGNTKYTNLGTVLDNSVNISQYFGIYCVFSSTRADKFRFDNFMVTGETVHEPKPPTSEQPALYDIVFNEIMADPSPAISLPDAEYIELFNKTNNNFSTKNWTVQVGNSNYKLPDTLFKAGEYLVLTTRASATQFSKWCTPIGLFTSSTLLTNTGQYLELRDSDGKVITWLEYEDTWYADDFKKKGGWSLEQMDPANPCGVRKNWKASLHKNGGTPGSKNSIYQQNTDNTPPYLKQIQVVNDSCVRLKFNEPIMTNALESNNFKFGVTKEQPLNCTFFEKGFSTVSLQLPIKLKDSTYTKVEISNSIADCAANSLELAIDTVIALPKNADSLSVIINEVLFNSKSYCPDYIEIYNRSKRILCSSDLIIGINNGNTENTYRLTNNGFLLYPGTYLLVSSDPEKLSGFYTLKNEYSLAAIPEMVSIDDNAGTISIKSLDYKIIDKFSYNEQMHIATLHNTEGVSLERINSETATYIPANWHSAAETAGFGTPGYQNSQHIEESNNLAPLPWKTKFSVRIMMAITTCFP